MAEDNHGAGQNGGGCNGRLSDRLASPVEQSEEVVGRNDHQAYLDFEQRLADERVHLNHLLGLFEDTVEPENRGHSIYNSISDKAASYATNIGNLDDQSQLSRMRDEVIQGIVNAMYGEEAPILFTPEARTQAEMHVSHIFDSRVSFYLVMLNSFNSGQNTHAVSTGNSEHHHMEHTPLPDAPQEPGAQPAAGSSLTAVAPPGVAAHNTASTSTTGHTNQAVLAQVVEERDRAAREHFGSKYDDYDQGIEKVKRARGMMVVGEAADLKQDPKNIKNYVCGECGLTLKKGASHRHVQTKHTKEPSKTLICPFDGCDHMVYRGDVTFDEHLASTHAEFRSNPGRGTKLSTDMRPNVQRRLNLDVLRYLAELEQAEIQRLVAKRERLMAALRSRGLPMDQGLADLNLGSMTAPGFVWPDTVELTMRKVIAHRESMSKVLVQEWEKAFQSAENGLHDAMADSADGDIDMGNEEDEWEEDDIYGAD